MSRTIRAGVAAGAVVALACATLPGSATAAPHASPAASKTAVHTSRGASPDKTFSPSKRADAMKYAVSREAAIKQQLGFSKAQGLHVQDVERDADGTLHLHYNRTLGGLKVIGGDFIVHQAANGKVLGTDFANANPLTVNTQMPTELSAVQAAHVVAKSMPATANVTSLSKAQKVVWAVSGIPRMAYQSTVIGHDARGNPIPRAVVVDANSGKVLQTWDLYESDTGTGHSLYVGDVTITTKADATAGHLMIDPTRGNAKVEDLNNHEDPNGPGFPPFTRRGPVFADTDGIWGDGTTSDPDSAAVDVSYGLAETWDYYKQTFGRNGIANNGKGALSRVHYGTDYDNAFWADSCFCMTFGDGSGTADGFKTVVGLDVAGHEMSHGVTSRTSGLVYFGDAGGLNEANSDIFGTMVEFFANNASDQGDYYIGDKIVVTGDSLRRMDNPQLDTFSPNCWGPRVGIMDPHFSSGPGNHFFYLLAEGSGAKTIGGLPHNSPVCGGAAAVQGVGRAKASRIWFRAMTRYFTSTEGYVDARDATIHSAIDLFGKGSAQCKQVVKAWNAVNVPSQYWTCNGELNEGKNTLRPSPGFEPKNSVWKSSGTGFITRKKFNVPTSQLRPRSGRFYAVINFQDAANNGSISRKINVPNSRTAMLRFYMAIGQNASGDGSVTDSKGNVTVLLNGKRVARFTQAYANNTYQRWDIKIGKFHGQKGVTLTIKSHENAPTLIGGYFGSTFDDFTVTPR